MAGPFDCIDFAADLPVFFDTVDGFAVPATHALAGSFAGVFDAPALDDPGAALELAELVCQAADVAAIVQGDTVTVAGTPYVVAGRVPDGDGVVRLVFHR